MKKILLVFALIMHVCVFVSTPGYGSGKIAQIKLPDSLSPGLLHLLALADPQQSEQFDSARIAKFLEFIKTPKNPNALYHADKIAGAPSAYYEFDVTRGLADILKYAFNPDIPGFITAPSSTRLSHWQQVEDHGQTVPKLWEKIATLDTPVVIRGVEVLENTPDTFSGAYYKYDLYRTLVLFRHGNRNVLISISMRCY